MKIARGDMWSQINKADAICITTNGYVRKDGAAVMGRGCAKQATERFFGIEYKLGSAITKFGNRGIILTGIGKTNIVSFPVKKEYMICSDKKQIVYHMRKKFSLGDKIPGWALIADLALIEKSAHMLVEATTRRGWQSVSLPQPGCGAGELSWTEVKPILDSILDDRFTIWTY